MKIINFNECFIIKNKGKIYILKDLLNAPNKILDLIDDINDYTYDESHIYFKSGYTLELKNLAEYNIKNYYSDFNQYNYNIMKIINKDNFLKIWFSNGDVKIFYLDKIKSNKLKSKKTVFY